MEKKVIQENAYNLIRKHGSDILAHPSFKALARNKQHHNSNTYAHLIHVTVLAVKIARWTRAKVDERALVRASLLHDYYLYDWHDRANRKKKHARKHGQYAADNAQRDFGITELERDLIVNHMWPINPMHFPKGKMGWIIVLADKTATFEELYGKLSSTDSYKPKKKEPKQPIES